MKRAIDSGRPAPLWPALRHGGAGVRQCAGQQSGWIVLPAGSGKVDGRWKLYCMVHNIEKLATRYAR